MVGTITRLLPNRGFGFIRGEDGISRFFKASNVEPVLDFDTMREGQAVDFNSVEDAAGKGNGLRAINVQVKVWPRL